MVAATGLGLADVDGTGPVELGAGDDVVEEEVPGVLEDGGVLEGPVTVRAGWSAMAAPVANSTIDTPTAIPAAPRLRSNAHQTRPRTSAMSATTKTKNADSINRPLRPELTAPRAATSNKPPHPNHDATPVRLPPFIPAVLQPHLKPGSPCYRVYPDKATVGLWLAANAHS